MRGLKLSVKLPLFVVLAVLLTASAGVSLSVLGRRMLQATVLEDGLHNAETYARAITFYLNNARSFLEATAAVPEMADWSSTTPVDGQRSDSPTTDDVRKRLIASRVLRYSKAFEYLMFLRLDGSVFLLEPPEHAGKLSRPNLAFADWYKEVMGSGRTVTSDLHISPTTQRPTVVIATPVRDATGRMVAIWAGALKLLELSRTGVEWEGSPPRRYGYVTDRRGLIIAHQFEPKYVREQTDFSTVPAVRAALAGESGAARYVNPIERNEEIGGYVPLRGTGWAVVYVIPTRTALAPMDGLTRNMVMVSAVLAALLGFLGCQGVRQIVRPLERLAVAAAAIGSGDFSRRIERRTDDEIGRLADAFNRMAAAVSEKEIQLRAHARQLEKTVLERTSALHQLEQANRELEDFSYSISHDLRSPLLSMNGFSRILIEEHTSELSAEARRYLQKVQDNSRQMGRLIDDLLTFSRMSRQPLEKQPVAPAHLVQQALEELRTEREGRRLEIAIGDLRPCDADPALLKQVFVNLLSNALKFSRGNNPARIEIGFQPAGDESVYFVRDNGVGFDMQYAGKLFGVFQRLHRADEYEGTGVGLAIVQRIVQRHGGRLWAEAEEDQGATFFFTLGK